MFKNIKKLSEFSLLLNERLVYDKHSPSSTPGEGSGTPEKPKNLNALRDEIELEFGKRLGRNAKALRAFIDEFEKAKPPMSASVANRKFAEAMGVGTLSDEATKGLVRELQGYLNKTTGSKMLIDGVIGSVTFAALKKRGITLEQYEAGAASEIVNPWRKGYEEEQKAYRIKNDVQVAYVTETFPGGRVTEFIRQRPIYNPKDWKEWNQAFAKAVASQENVSDEDEAQYVRELQMQLGLQVIDGRFGPVTLAALKKELDYKADQSKKETPPAKPAAPKDKPKEEPASPEVAPEEIAAIFTNDVQGKYRYLRWMKDGSWKDLSANAVDPEEALPQVATKVLGGEIYYMKDTGNKDFYFKKNGKEAHKYTTDDLQGEFYFRLSNEEWIDKEGVKKAANEIVPKVATAVQGKEGKKIYILYGENGQGDFYDEDGKRIKPEDADSQPPTPKPVTIDLDSLPSLKDIYPWEQMRKALEDAKFMGIKHGEINAYQFNVPETVPPHLAIRMTVGADGAVEIGLSDIYERTIDSKKAPDNLKGNLPGLLKWVKEWAVDRSKKLDTERKKETKERGLTIDKLSVPKIQEAMHKAGFTGIRTNYVEEGARHEFTYKGRKCSMVILDNTFFKFTYDGLDGGAGAFFSVTPEQFSKEKNHHDYREKDLPGIMNMIKFNIDGHMAEGKQVS